MISIVMYVRGMRIVMPDRDLTISEAEWRIGLYKKRNPQAVFCIEDENNDVLYEE